MYACCLIFRARGSKTTPADHEFVVEASLLLTGNFVLNNPPRGRIRLQRSYAWMRLEVASAYTLVFFIMIIPLLVAMQLFADREQRK